MSSGAAEVYAAGNATQEMLELSYAASDIGIDFPQPAILKMDNAAAEAFANNSCFKSKLKHIDCRQQWVRTLRDKLIVIPQHVPTIDNLADLFTKILPTPTFIRLRNRMMKQLPDTIK
jgi:histone deacetylase 1/2